MNRPVKKLLSLLLSAAMLTGLALPAMAAEGEDAEGIVVLYTNDVHCTDDDGMSYAAIAGYKAEMEAAYGAGNVILVDNGDAIQGGILGAMSKGSWIVDIMNQVGYDLAIPGNHEFDFGMDTFLDIATNQAEYTYLSCNFVDAEGNTVLEPYLILTYDDVDVAFVGISTPETLTKSAPAYFQDEDGNFIYGFCQGEEGKELYDQVQETVDAAREAGADYVVALAHLGVDAQSSPWMSTEVIANTTGIDVVLDGHSHTVEPSTLVENADGEEVLLSQTGTKAESVGKLVIAPDGTMTAELVALADVDTTSQAYGDAKTFIEGIQEEYQEKATEVVATSDVELTVNDPDTGERAVRSAETNLGDLCADAYRTLLDADVAFVNGGGVRANISAGDVTYGDIIEVHPFGNLACLVEVSGQQLLDALEMGSMQVGVSENGGFLQVSGLKYTINTAIPTSVELDDAGNFVQVAGDRRVSGVQVLDSETGEYAPLDPEATYTLASHNYMLKLGGDGYTMFGEDKVTMLKDEVMVDNEVLIRYIQDELGGVIGEEYADPHGQGRITIVNEAVSQYPSDLKETDWYYEAAVYALDNDLMNGTNVGFEPNSDVTVFSVYQMLYNMEGRPAVDPAQAVEGTEGAWYADCLNWAQAQGLYVRPSTVEDSDATRAAVAGIFADYATWKGVTVDTSGMAMQEAPDYGTIQEADLEGMTFCYYAGLMTGNQNGELMPYETLSRAEFAQMLMNYDALMSQADQAA